MLLALAYCHRDVDAAWRLMQWMEHLERQGGGSVKGFECVIVASKLVSRLSVNTKIQDKANSLFKKVHYHISTAHENGWPSSANETFLFTMREAAKLDDALWMEPDAVPISPGWLEVINLNWVKAKAEGKHFMGAKVDRPAPAHLSGIAVYSQDWEKVAPSLAQVPDNTGWDLYGAAEVMPHAQCTPFIQNEWNPKPGVRARLDTGCVIYHQCKTGELMQLLARERGQTFNLEPNQTYSMRYFKSANASRKYRFQEVEIKFEIYEILGGVPSGIFATDNKDALTALDSVIADGKYGIQEIEKPEYEALAKKKLRTPGYIDSRVMSQREWSGKAVVPPAVNKPSSEPEPPPVVPLETILQVFQP